MLAKSMRMLCATMLVSLTACAPAPTAVNQAQSFWDAIAEERAADAAAVTTEGDADRRLRRLRISAAEVERMDIPAQAQVAQLPTRVVPDGEDAGTNAAATITSVTVMVRTADGWRVDADATLDAYRSATVGALGDRLGDSADRLARAFGMQAEDLSRAARELGGALSELVEDTLTQTLPERGEALAERIAPELEAAGDAIVEGVEALERALDDAARRAEENARENAEANGGASP